MTTGCTEMKVVTLKTSRLANPKVVTQATGCITIELFLL